MKRNAGLSRSPFKRKPPVVPERAPWPRAPLEPVTGARAATMQSREHAISPIEKYPYVRSQALILAYRKLACQNCHRISDTVCGAHSNWSVHGKGKGIKADDSRCASLCLHCHLEIDQGSSLLESERKRLWWFAHVKTVRALIALKLWPPEVPRPDLSPAAAVALLGLL